MSHPICIIDSHLKAMQPRKKKGGLPYFMTN